MSTESVAPAPQPEPKKKSIGKKILGYIVALIVGGVVIYGFNYFTSDVAQAKPGDCAAISGTSTSPEYKPVECTAAEANFTVAKAGGTSEVCPDNYAEYTQSQRRGPKTKLCLAPLYVEGKCYGEATGGATDKAVECTGTAKFKVTKVVKDAAAPQCPEGEEVRSFPEAKLNYCVAPPA